MGINKVSLSPLGQRIRRFTGAGRMVWTGLPNRLKPRMIEGQGPQILISLEGNPQHPLGILDLARREFFRARLGELPRPLRAAEMLAAPLGADVPRNRVTKTVAVLKGVDLDGYRTGANNRNLVIRFSALRASFGQMVCRRFVPSVNRPTVSR